ncbi:glutathione S-transferase family protein [Nannocystaceae bacterium ST9]
MSYVLYGANGSGSSIVEAALAEIGVDYTLNPVDMAKAAQRDAAYASINPHRKVPTLLGPENETLTESVAIVLTLAERHPDAGLLPPIASRERARALRWMLFAATELYPIIEIVDYPDRFAPDEASKLGVREVALANWRSRWSTVEQGLSEGPFVLGDEFCIADIYLAVLSRWDLSSEWRAANIPKVERLAVAVAQRPRLQELWRRHFGPR